MEIIKTTKIGMSISKVPCKLCVKLFNNCWICNAGMYTIIEYADQQIMYNISLENNEQLKNLLDNRAYNNFRYIVQWYIMEKHNEAI
jgi:hypothetical protein